MPLVNPLSPTTVPHLDWGKDASCASLRTCFSPSSFQEAESGPRNLHHPVELRALLAETTQINKKRGPYTRQEDRKGGCSAHDKAIKGTGE